MSDTASAHEERARATKAFKITTLLRRFEIRTEEARNFTEAQWRVVADAAGTNPPSPTTVALVLTWLEESEQT